MIPTGALTRRRFLALLCALGVICCALAGQLVNLQLIMADDLQQRAQSQWTGKSRVSARRGEILDRNGTVLAMSATAYAVSASPRQVKDPEAFAQALASVVDVDAQRVAQQVSDKTKGGVTLKRQVPRETAQSLLKLREELRAQKDDSLDGLYLEEDQLRVYPMGAFLTQVLGLTTIDGVGQSGLEKQLDDYLRGRDGVIVNEVDGRGNELPYSVSEYTPPVDGGDVTLTIDAAIQGFAEKAMRECISVNEALAVQAIVMDVNTGGVLAMVTKPDFDPNDPPRDDVEALTSMMRIRSISDVYEPGSTFKILTAAAALETGVTEPEEHFYCSGSVTVDGSRIRCWGNPHGEQTMAEAIQNSCNPVFVELGLRLGTARLYSYMHAFGLGSKTGIDLAGESSGILIAQDNVKTVDLARIGFGQSVAVTPIQLITAVSAVANGGKLMQPYIISSITNAEGNVVAANQPKVVSNPITSETSALMRELLENVVEFGGGKNARIEGIRVAGKTGTAQIYRDGVISSDAHIGSFIGFAPADDPKIAVLVIVHEARMRPDYGSVTAAPYARDILSDSLAYLGIYPTADEDGEPVEEVEAPDVRGLKLGEAVRALSEAGLDCLTEGAGELVVDQLPQAGARVNSGSQVLLYLENEYEQDVTDVQVPDVSGKSIVEAARQLSSCALRLNISGSGLAVAQSPSAGERVPVGAEITVEFELP